MAKRIQRTEPPYVQIAEHYQRLIQDGTLDEGDRLPSVRQIADEWGVVRATANRSVRYLEAAQLVEITRQGTVVGRRRATPAPRDRILRRQRLDAESVEVTDAGQVTRTYVARLLGLDDDALVVRREQITYRNGEPIVLAVHWLPGSLAEDGPELLNAQPLDTLGIVHAATGRAPTLGNDGVSSRLADQREATALGLPVGSSVLAGVWIYSDGQGVIEYGEYVAPPDHVVTYDYDISTESSQA